MGLPPVLIMRLFCDRVVLPTIIVHGRQRQRKEIIAPIFQRHYAFLYRLNSRIYPSEALTAQIQ